MGNAPTQVKRVPRLHVPAVDEGTLEEVPEEEVEEMEAPAEEDLDETARSREEEAEPEEPASGNHPADVTSVETETTMKHKPSVIREVSVCIYAS